MNRMLRTTKCTLYIFLLIISSNVSSQSNNKNSLSAADRVYGLSKIWSEAKYNFVYIDKVVVDWDCLYEATLPAALGAEDTKIYYDVLRQFISHLHDGHTSVWYPSSFYKNEFAYAPLRIRKGEDLVLKKAQEVLKQKVQ